MTVFLISVLLICGLGVLHTYVLYPWWLLAGARPQVPGEAGHEGSQIDRSGSSPDAGQRGADQDVPEWPPVTVLMAVHNEEAVLADKLASLDQQDYSGVLRVRIGSDCSTDRTNEILRRWAGSNRWVREFSDRQGKPNIINQLAQASGVEGILVITDASVMLAPDTVRELVRPMLADARVGVVDATMVQTGARPSGIGRAEKNYIDREVRLKRAEGRRWGAMIGPFGGCWALRAAAYRPVPPTFLVDDFYLCMAAYEQGYRGVSSAEAVVYEGVGQSLREEFRRKVRISSGNWQNLVRFRNLWWPPWRDGLAFAFFSHKVLRWWTPFFLLFGAGAWVLLIVTSGNYWATLLFALVVIITIGLALVDVLLTSFGVHLRAPRAMRYFLAMNAALLVGFWRYLTGIESNVWQPPPRN